ncbi:MAG: hypothetical protein HY427_03590 [Candidatus Levybacteria bacterium]|nr:hypothetical protein [Candidatus Levybacteria bacterium]
MLKGRIILLFVTAFFALTGAVNKTIAATVLPSASSCSSMLVSTPLCDELLTQSCINEVETNPDPNQSSVIISSPKESSPQTTVQTQPEILVTPTSNPVEPVLQQQNLNSDRIFDLINQHRASQGLAPFELEVSVCELAKARSAELAGELVNGTIHSGLYNRNLTFWIWENAKVGSNEDETVAWWISSPLHHQSIVGNYKYSCVKCSGNNCSELFTSFSPK